MPCNGRRSGRTQFRGQEGCVLTASFVGVRSVVIGAFVSGGTVSGIETVSGAVESACKSHRVSKSSTVRTTVRWLPALARAENVR